MRISSSAKILQNHYNFQIIFQSEEITERIKQKIGTKAQNFRKKEGWCDSVGSVEDIQAKLLKRREATAKRERAMAHALAHQWRAGSRRQASTSEEPAEDTNSRSMDRSYSNPKERPKQHDKQAKKRLSLPSSGLGAQAVRRPNGTIAKTPM